MYTFGRTAFGVFLAGLLLVLGCGGPDKAGASLEPSLFEWMVQDSATRLVLEMDISAMLKDKEKEAYRPAQITCYRKDSLLFSKEIKVSPRGEARKRLCDFPPLKLNFDKDDLREENRKTFDIFKLVTFCKEDTAFREVVFREYLAYRLMNIITDTSFRVKLLEVTYHDSSGGFETREHWGFLVEHHDELADRLGAKVIRDEKQVGMIEKEAYKRLVLAQLMLGNTDWNLGNGHNIKMLSFGEQSLPVPVSYDFDCSGLVNAPYAVPHPQLPIRSVEERFLQWRGSPEEDFRPQIRALLERRDILMKCISEPVWLPRAEKDRMRSYLETFFSLISQPGIATAGDLEKALEESRKASG